MDAKDTNLSESVFVPADHQDQNHPHYSGDLEGQPAAHHSPSGKKGFWVAGVILTIIMLVIAAVLWGVALTHDKTETTKIAEVAVPINTTTLIHYEVQTVYEDTTTFIYSTTRMPLLVAPSSLTTSTIVLSPTPRVRARPEAPLPVLDKPSEPFAPSDAPSGDTSSTSCLFSGAWALKKQCERHCPAWKVM